jgi:phosphatidylglycerophosphatase A
MSTSLERPCADLWRKPIHFFAVGFGAGCVPRAPGTCGTLIAIPLYWLLQDLAWWLYLLLTGLAFLLGVWLCGRTATDLGVHDHPSIVWDEIVSYLITMIAAPKGWLWMVIGFGLFRLFDIWKPWPIRQLDQGVGGGWGIMLDDVLAGSYAWLTVQSIAILVSKS